MPTKVHCMSRAIYFSSSSIDELIDFYYECGIINLCDVKSSTEDELVNKILKSVHPFAVFYDSNKNCYRTTIKDSSKPDGRKQVTRKTKYQLELFLLQHYQISCTKVYTFANLYEELMAYETTFKAAATITCYVKAFKKYYRDDPIIHENLNEIKAIDLEIWLKKQIEKYKLSFKSYSKMSVLFTQMYSYANRKGYIDNNPFKNINVKDLGLYPEIPKKSSQKVFNKNEIKDIYKIIFDDFNNKPYCVPLAVMLIFQTGIRMGEAVALKWCDIDFEAKKLFVCRYEEAYQLPSDDFSTLNRCKYQIVEMRLKKRQEPRYVDLTDDAIYVLQLLKDYYESINLKSEWLFFSKRENDKCHCRAIDLRIRKYCREAGLPYIKSTHKIRSTYISIMRDAGLSFAKIREEVGHKQLTTTINNYIADINTDEENMQIMNNSALKIC